MELSYQVFSTHLSHVPRGWRSDVLMLPYIYIYIYHTQCKLLHNQLACSLLNPWQYHGLYDIALWLALHMLLNQSNVLQLLYLMIVVFILLLSAVQSGAQAGLSGKAGLCWYQQCIHSVVSASSVPNTSFYFYLFSKFILYFKFHFCICLSNQKNALVWLDTILFSHSWKQSLSAIFSVTSFLTNSSSNGAENCLFNNLQKSVIWVGDLGWSETFSFNDSVNFAW